MSPHPGESSPLPMSSTGSIRAYLDSRLTLEAERKSTSWNPMARVPWREERTLPPVPRKRPAESFYRLTRRCPHGTRAQAPLLSVDELGLDGTERALAKRCIRTCLLTALPNCAALLSTGEPELQNRLLGRIAAQARLGTALKVFFYAAFIIRQPCASKGQIGSY